MFCKFPLTATVMFDAVFLQKRPLVPREESLSEEDIDDPHRRRSTMPNFGETRNLFVEREGDFGRRSSPEFAPRKRLQRSPLSAVVLLILGCQPAVESPAQKPPDIVRSAVANPAGDPVAVEQRASIRFANQAEQSGVNFEYRNGEEAGVLAILESLGGGVGIWDYDQDGDLDLFFPGGGTFASNAQPIGRAGAMYRQDAPWQFSLVTEMAGLQTDAHYTHGAAIADADNDGFPDLIVTGYGGLLFFRNQGDGTFIERTRDCGLDDRLWSSSAAWCDLNQDGALDLYAAHYVNWSPGNNPACPSVGGDHRDVCSPRQFDPLPDVLYFGQGDGTFRDGSREAGLSTLGKGLGVLIADVDLDGRQDVYVANDTDSNFLYRNTGHGSLEDISSSSGTSVNDRGLPDGSMGADIGDFNLDGLPDLWVSNYERESFAVYRNFGNGLFRHVSQATEVTAVGARFVGWGTTSFDVDCDGDEDVFVSNGHVVHFPVVAPLLQAPLLFENIRGKKFEDVAARAGVWMSSPHAGRGCAGGDLDLDGDLDLVVSSVNEPVSILANETMSQHHWVQIRLIGIVSNRDAQGARVLVRTNSAIQSRQVKGGGSYASTGESWLHFGLANAERIQNIEILWPSGGRQSVNNLMINGRHTVIEQVSGEVKTE